MRDKKRFTGKLYQTFFPRISAFDYRRDSKGTDVHLHTAPLLRLVSVHVQPEALLVASETERVREKTYTDLIAQMFSDMSWRGSLLAKGQGGFGGAIDSGNDPLKT